MKAQKLRNAYKWDVIISNLITKFGSYKIAKYLNVTERTVRRWKEGTRIPSHENIIKLKKWEQQPLNV